MNERITELADKAWHHSTFVPNDVRPQITIFQEKFAELIVKECVDIARDSDGNRHNGTGNFIAGEIREHFGVDE